MSEKPTSSLILDSSDVSVVISVKIDSPQRRRNLHYVIDYLSTIAPQIELLVVEQDIKSQLDLDHLTQHNVYHVLVPSDGSHWKTRNLNLGAKLASRSILLFLDCDLLLTAQALDESICGVRTHGGFYQPYNGVFVEFNGSLVEKECDVFDLLENAPHFSPEYDQHLSSLDFSFATPVYGGSSYLATGGAMVCDRKDFFLIGGYNENFIAYGFEDMEFFERIAKFGYEVARVSNANAYHLPHPRGMDSTYSDYYRTNEDELARVRAMSPGELRRYVYNGFRTLQFNGGKQIKVTQDKDHYHIDLLPDERTSLSDQELVFLVTAIGAGYSDARLERVFRFLEQHFRSYWVVVYERGGRTLQHPRTMKNYLYTWLDPKLIDEQQALELAQSRAKPRFCLEFVDQLYDPAALIHRLQQFTQTRSKVRSGNHA